MKKRFTIRGITVYLSKEDVINSVRGIAPEPIRLYYVEIEGVPYPVKQVLGCTLDSMGVDRYRVDFTSQYATGVLRGLDFEVKRV